MAVDCIGICKFHTMFLSPNMPNFKEFSELIRLVTDLDIPPGELWKIADRCYTLERLFNLREGFTREDDWLVDRYFDEPTDAGLEVVRNKAIDRDKFARMIDEYYEHHGWDDKGVPTKETLEKLGIAAEPSHKL